MSKCKLDYLSIVSQAIHTYQRRQFFFKISKSRDKPYLYNDSSIWMQREQFMGKIIIIYVVIFFSGR